MPTLRSGFVLALATLLGLTGCSRVARTVSGEVPALPPLEQVGTPLSTITPYSQKYKVAVLTFIDQTGKASLVTDNVADVLTTSLFDTDRFALYDRQDLTQDATTKTISAESDTGTRVERSSRSEIVRGEAFIPEGKTSEQYNSLLAKRTVDGVLLGYVTSYQLDSETTGVFSFDYRIVNSVGLSDGVHAEAQLQDLVVLSGSGKVRFSTDPGRASIILNREDVDAVAATIQQAFAGDFTRLSKGDELHVQKVEGDKIVIDAGESSGIRQGFVGYVVRSTKLGTYDYLAMFVVVNTFDDASVGFLVGGDSMSVDIGRLVKMK